MGIENLLQSVVSAAEYCGSVFLRKSGSLGKFYSLLVVHWPVTGL